MDRTCIVTREAGEPDGLIRFVAAPDGQIVPDLKRALPGRGCWVTGTRGHVEKALAKKLFARALKREVSAAPDLGAVLDRLLERNALGLLGLARKGGALVLGATQVEKAVRAGRAYLVLHALEASADGERKLANARYAVAALGGPEVTAWKLFGKAELGLALGGANVIHAAVLGEGQGRAVEKRLEALHRYREGNPAHRIEVKAPDSGWTGSAADGAADGVIEDDWHDDDPAEDD